MRRYRILFLVATFLLVTIYYSAKSGAFEYRRLGRHNRKAGFHGKAFLEDPILDPVAPLVTAVSEDEYTRPQEEKPLGDFNERIESNIAAASTDTTTTYTSARIQPTSTSTSSSVNSKAPYPPLPVDKEEQNPGKHDASDADSDDTVRWRKPKAQYPLQASEVIKLPSGSAQKIPEIQAIFGSESASEKQDRLTKLNVVKESFQHAWNGYKKYGLPHDEVKPLSKDFADPFMGWGATLVDTLDTLWIMDLKKEFEDAVVTVGKIDFKTSPRSDIPVFETVIRYLGGLLAAYDISGAKYPILLEKAEELTEVLMGAFDTPNRMPMTFYNWKPADTKSPHRASSKAVMSEIGSLAIEMTRLAQITKKHEYYDAVARITNELEKWQSKTLLPGLWPLKVDASGCQKDEKSATRTTDDDDNSVEEDTVKLKIASLKHSNHEERDSSSTKGHFLDPEEQETDDQTTDGSISVRKQKMTNFGCKSQGLASAKDVKTEVFGIGGQADSTYEYFPKMHALLRGRNKQYETMYLNAMTTIRESLLFRPMIKEEEREILFVARQEFTPTAKDVRKREETIYEVTHLSCFIGGMVGLGARLFGIERDLDLAKQLTDGCVWAYESMPIGIMAETASVVPCPSLEVCAWNNTRWYEALDPEQEERFKAVMTWNKNQKAVFEKSKKPVQMDSAVAEEEVAAAKPTRIGKSQDPEYDYAKAKRDGSSGSPSKTDPLPAMDEAADYNKQGSRSKTSGNTEYSPKTAMSHDKYVKARIEEERLPESYTKIFDRHYGLRPEAVESVFYMYRITGDKIWQQKGWQMFLAIQAATQTEVANAAVKDVTSMVGTLDDTMESFWLAETLKYFYLLFSEPDVISLDEWVLNTEAHPMKIETR